MSTGEKKSATSATPAPSTSSQPAPQDESTPPTSKKPLVSRRTFLKAAVGASTVLAAASMATSGQILGPLIPDPEGLRVIANAVALESDYARLPAGSTEIVSRFFSWPYAESESPYYKNILVRLPDELVPDPGPTPSISHYASWNLTCVHLRCIVNPGRDDDEYRLLCPCHGSQYRLKDAVPVKGPAKVLGLRPLPRIRLRLGSDNSIIAEEFDGEPGIGRTQI